MLYKTKSILIGRKKEDKKEGYTAFISLCRMNNPHKSGEAPRKVLEYPGARNVKIYNCSIKYLLQGNDLVINDLDSVDIEESNNRIYIKCNQKKNPSL